MVDKDRWRYALRFLPTDELENLEQFLAEYEEGMDFGLGEHAPSPVHSRSNPKMDLESRIKMAQTILKWYNRNYLIGPFSPDDPLVRDLRLNPVFCVPKPDGTVRPVVNYSKSIKGASLNELLDPQLCTVEYLKIREIVFTIRAMGKGAMMWAKDLEDGYFNIKISPFHVHQIAFQFAGMVFVPMVMVFGLSSAPLIFTIFMWYVVMAIRFANTDLMWGSVPTAQFDRSAFQTDADIFVKGGRVYFPLVTYYLDDIFGIHHPNMIRKQYSLAGEVLKFLGLSAKEAKDRPPSTTQKILGLEYDSVLQEVRTPLEKVEKYCKFAADLISRAQITKKQLFSLSGKIRHAAMQCKPLAAFARGIEIHGANVHRWTHHINMSRRLKRDIHMMMEGLKACQSNGLPFDFILHPDECFDMHAFTDAASTIGIGGFIQIPDAPYFQVRWKDVDNVAPWMDILWKEMAAILVLFILYKDQFRGKIVCVWSDNKPDIDMLIRWHAPLHRPDLQILIRKIAEICIHNRIRPWWSHIAGERNVAADKLSRFTPLPFTRELVTPQQKPSSLAKQALQSAIDLCL